MLNNKKTGQEEKRKYKKINDSWLLFTVDPNFKKEISKIENITDINKERAEAAIKRAQKKLKDNEADLTRGKAAMSRAKNRLKITSR